MFSYYLNLAVRSLRRNKVLTGLMMLAVGLGIGASITSLTVLRLLSGDPLPDKSDRLVYAQLDPRGAENYTPGETKPMPTLDYIDAMALLHGGKGVHQAAVSLTQAKITPERADAHPFFGDAVMTTADFFTLFEVPFRYGGGWTAADDDGKVPVVVIAGFLNDKLFDGANSVGKTLHINDHEFRISGVLGTWAPQPRFYAIRLGGHSYGDGDAVFLPLKTARSDDMSPGSINCFAMEDISKLETAPSCTWIGLWAEVASTGDVAAYKAWLANYARDQIAIGRYHRPEVDAPTLMEWMRRQHVVPDDVTLQSALALGFLLICVVNTVGLLLAKCLRRSREIGVRRALGATRTMIFGQFMVEAAIVGLAGGLLGLLFAELGLWGIRHQPAEYASLARLDLQMFIFTFVVALVSSLIAGILPAWRACLVAPAPQLKSA